MIAVFGIVLAGAAAPAAAAPEIVITSHSDGDFVSGREVTVQGTATEGTGIRVTAGGSTPCQTISAEGRWSCRMSLPDGAVAVTVTPLPAASGQPVPPGPMPPSPTPTAPTPTPTAPTPLAAPTGSVTITLHVLGPPTIAGSGAVVTTGLVTGAAYPRAGIRVRTVPVTGGASTEVACPAAAADGSWYCPVDAASGEYSVQAWQFSPDDPSQSSPRSAPRPLTVDREVPSAPVMESPRNGDRVPTSGAGFSGTGESGTAVDVFADGVLLCSATVGAGRWSCAAGTAMEGSRTVQGIQRDPAGNYSPPSAPATVEFSDGGTAPAPTAPTDPAPEPAVPPAPDDPGGESGPIMPTDPGTGAPPGSSDWGAPSGFGGSLPSVASAVSGNGWVLGLLFGAAFALIIALPARLLGGALRARGIPAAPRIFGRNRRREPDSSPLGPAADGPRHAGPRPRRRWLVVVIALAAATVITALASGVQGEPRFARMLLSVGIGIAVVNAVGVVLTSALVARAGGARRALRLMPVFLVVGLIGALASRLAGIEPPVVVGMVLAVATVGAAGARAGALMQLAQVGSIAALATASWIAHDLVVDADGFWGQSLAETFAAICITGFGSAVLLLIPVGSLPGRAIFDWSPGAWFATCIPVVGIGAMAFTASSGFPTLAVVGAACAIGALCLAGWAWMRFIEPTLAAR